MLGLIPTPVALAQALQPAPLILFNDTPSEPTGLYLRSSDAPAVGTIIAFRPPAAAWPYVGEALPARARTSILKTIRAGQGDQVCAERHVLAIKGHPVARIARADRQGRTLPGWSGCRRLGEGEYFVLSTRIPNSFDSRYYGPVRRGDILAVYTPLLAPPGPPSAS